MKIRLTIFWVLLNGILFSQRPNTFNELKTRDVFLDLNLGTPNTFATNTYSNLIYTNQNVLNTHYNGFGVFAFRFEFLLHKKFGVGYAFDFSTGKSTYQEIKSYTPMEYYYFNHKNTLIRNNVMFSLHNNFCKNRMVVRLSALLGQKIEKTIFTTDKPTIEEINSSNKKINIGGELNVKYFLNSNININLSFSALNLYYLSVGIGVKF